MDWERERHVPVEERLARIETILGDLVHYLKGNGQKGVIDKMDDRITILEQFRWQFAGAAVLITVVIGFAEFILHVKGK